MSSIDERVVEMKFDNAQFERGVKETTKSLQGLDKSLDLKGTKSGLSGLAQAAKNFTLGGISNSVQSIAGKFTNLGIVGVTALANIANRAVNAGVTLGKSLTIDPIMQGFSEYELKMGSIQTILANTARHGTTLDDVTASLDDLNDYADKTIYNFGDMTRNIGLFTNAGIDVGPATSMIKGFSNAAAASGTSSQGAAGAAYQLSQAMSAGTIRLMDWRSLTNVGMGNKNMQDGILQIADAMGTFEGSGTTATEAAKDFNGSLEKGWLSSDVMSAYLEIMAGDMDAAKMAAMGLTEEQIKGFQAQQKTAEEAATKVRTITQLVGTLQEAVGSSWAQTAEILLGDFDEATELFTNVSDTLGGIIGKMGDERNKLLEGWDELGGRKVLIEALGNAFNALMAVLTPIGKAFRQIFPPTTAETLFKITEAIAKFTEGLIIGEGAAGELQRTFAGFFAVIGIGWEIVKALAGAIFEVVGALTGGAGGVLSATASFGDFLVMLHNAVKEGDIFGKVFGKVADVIVEVIKGIGKAFSWIGDQAGDIGGKLKEAFGNMDFSWLIQILDNLKKRLEPLGEIGDWIAEKFEKLIGILRGGGKKSGGGGGGAKKGNPLDESVDKIEELKEKLGPAFEIIEGIFNGIKDMFKNFNPSVLLDGVNTGLLGVIALLIKKMIGTKEGGTSLELDFGLASFGQSIKDTVGSITDSMSVMQNTLKAATILQIAIAIGVLAAAAAVLASIDSAGLTRALSAIGIMLVELYGAMELFTKITSAKDLGEILVLNAALILLGIALNILAGAVKKLSELSWEDLAKGLLGVLVLLGGLVGVSKLMSKSSGGMIRSGIGLIIIGLALKLLVSSVKDLSEMSWEELLAGIGGVSALLLAIAGFTRLVGNPGKTIAAAISLAIMAGALKLLSMSIESIAEMSWDELTRGLAGLAIGMGLITAALTLIKGKNEFAGAIVFALAAGSILVLADSLKTMGDMSPAEIGKAVVALATSLGILVGAMKLMSGNVVGALSLVVIAAALWVLIPLFVELGQMSWNEIAKASVALLAALALIAAGMYAMSGTIVGAATMLIIVAALWVLIPLFVELGQMSWNEIAKASVALLAVLGLIAAGLYLMTGAIVGAAALVIVSAALTILIPVLMLLSTLSWGELLMGLAALAGVFIVLGLAGLVLAPVIPSLLLLGAAILLLGAGAALAGIGMLAFAMGFTALGLAVAANGLVIINFVKDMIGLIPYAAEQLGLGIVAVAQVIINAFPVWVNAMVTVLSAIISAINTMAPQIINTLWNLIMLMASTLSANVPVLVQKGLELLLGILRGIRDNIQQIVTVALEIITNFINGISDGLPAIVEAGYNLIITFVESLADTIRNNQSRMDTAGRDLAGAIIDGMTSGIRNGASTIANAAKDAAKGALDSAKNFLGIKSPSRAFMEVGKFADQGFAVGLTRHAKTVEKSSEKVGAGALGAIRESMRNISNLVNDEMDSDPTIRPVLDLSDIETKASRLNGLFDGKTVSASVSYGSASKISNDRQTSVAETLKKEETPGSITYQQYNYSPKALSSVDIYRRTKNQMSTLRRGGSSAGFYATSEG